MLLGILYILKGKHVLHVRRTADQLCNNERHAQAIYWMTDVCTMELRSHVINYISILIRDQRLHRLDKHALR